MQKTNIETPKLDPTHELAEGKKPGRIKQAAEFLAGVLKTHQDVREAQPGTMHPAIKKAIDESTAGRGTNTDFMPEFADQARQNITERQANAHGIPVDMSDAFIETEIPVDNVIDINRARKPENHPQ